MVLLVCLVLIHTDCPVLVYASDMTVSDPSDCPVLVCVFVHQARRNVGSVSLRQPIVVSPHFPLIDLLNSFQVSTTITTHAYTRDTAYRTWERKRRRRRNRAVLDLQRPNLPFGPLLCICVCLCRRAGLTWHSCPTNHYEH